MGREFTVYGLRFSKTSFWNHVNTGFLDPAVATALTACGIETAQAAKAREAAKRLQQRLPLAVLKPEGVELQAGDVVKLQQRLPLAVLKHQHCL